MADFSKSKKFPRRITASISNDKLILNIDGKKIWCALFVDDEGVQNTDDDKQTKGQSAGSDICLSL